MGCWSAGRQQPYFRAEKWAWRPLEAIPSSGANERKLRAVGTDPVAKVLDRFEPLGLLGDNCNKFRSVVLKILAKTAQNGPFLAVFRGFLRREGSKQAENLVDRTLYLYGPHAFDRLGF